MGRKVGGAEWECIWGGGNSGWCLYVHVVFWSSSLFFTDRFSLHVTSAVNFALHWHLGELDYVGFKTTSRKATCAPL